MQGQTLLSSWFDAVVDQFELHGIDRRALTKGLKGSVEGQLAPTREVGLLIARRLWHRAARISDDPMLGLKIGCGLPMQAMNVVGLMMMHSATLGDALDVCIRYQTLVSNSGRIALEREVGSAMLTYAIAPCPTPMHPMQIDSLVGALLSFLARSCAKSIAPRMIALPGTALAEASAYNALLGAPVMLGAPGVRIEYATETLGALFQGADPALFAIARAHADGMMRFQARSTSLVDKVREAIRARAFVGTSCSELADEMGLTTRTLQRRLAALGSPFRRLHEATRMEEAYFLLTDGTLPLSEIQTRLSYVEPSSFWHAVRAYWGLTPRELRFEAATISQ